MEPLAQCVENFISFTEMVGGDPAGGLLRLPDGSVAGASGLDSAGENYAVFSRDARDAEVTSVMTFFEARRLPFMVSIFPGENEKLCGALEHNGVLHRFTYTAMTLPLHGASAGDADVVEVTDDEGIGLWADATWLGFGGEGACDTAYFAHARYMASCAENRMFYLKRDGVAVCAGLLLESRNACGLYYFATPPVFRRQGYARRLMKTLAAEAAKRADSLVLLATKEGAPLYKACGFQSLAAVPVRCRGEE